MSHVPFLCKLVPQLPNIHFLAIYPSIMMITEQIRCLHLCYEGQRLWKYHLLSDYSPHCHVILQILSKCKNNILAVLSWDKLEKLREFVWGYVSDLFPQ